MNNIINLKSITGKNLFKDSKIVGETDLGRFVRNKVGFPQKIMRRKAHLGKMPWQRIDRILRLR